MIGFKFFNESNGSLSSIESWEHVFNFVFNVESSRNSTDKVTSILAFTEVQDAMKWYATQLDNVINHEFDDASPSFLFDIGNAKVFRCDCKQSEKDYIRWWTSEDKPVDVPIKNLPKGSIICDSVIVQGHKNTKFKVHGEIRFKREKVNAIINRKAREG